MVKIAFDSNVLYSMFTNTNILYNAIDEKAKGKEIVVGIPKYCLLEIEPVFRDKLGEYWQERYEALLAWSKTHAYEIPLPRGHVLKRYRITPRYF